MTSNFSSLWLDTFEEDFSNLDVGLAGCMKKGPRSAVRANSFDMSIHTLDWKSYSRISGIISVTYKQLDLNGGALSALKMKRVHRYT